MESDSDMIKSTSIIKELIICSAIPILSKLNKTSEF